MDARIDPPRRRGRPPKQHDDLVATRDMLLRTGLEVLTEKGFSATADEIPGRAGVPKAPSITTSTTRKRSASN